VSWYWETGDGAVYTQASFSHSYTEPGIYMGYLLITNEWGCTAEVNFPIEIKYVPAIYVPNTFTPNGDGMNDTFMAQGMNFVEYEMWIFDRWGELLYFTNHLNKPWNGSRDNLGGVLKSDVYVYRIRVRDVSGNETILNGNINLIP
jgi:gliding motility-associated-like protein